MEFALVGNMFQKSNQIEKSIRKHGGKVVSIIHDKLAAVIISNRHELEKMGFQMIQAKKHNIQVISDEFLSEVTTTDPMLYIISKSLSDWGGDVSSIHMFLITAEMLIFTYSLPAVCSYRTE